MYQRDAQISECIRLIQSFTFPISVIVNLVTAFIVLTRTPNYGLRNRLIFMQVAGFINDVNWGHLLVPIFLFPNPCVTAEGIFHNQLNWTPTFIFVVFNFISEDANKFQQIMVFFITWNIVSYFSIAFFRHQMVVPTSYRWRLGKKTSRSFMAFSIAYCITAPTLTVYSERKLGAETESMRSRMAIPNGRSFGYFDETGATIWAVLLLAILVILSVALVTICALMFHSITISTEKSPNQKKIHRRATIALLGNYITTMDDESAEERKRRLNRERQAAQRAKLFSSHKSSESVTEDTEDEKRKKHREKMAAQRARWSKERKAEVQARNTEDHRMKKAIATASGSGGKLSGSNDDGGTGSAAPVAGAVRLAVAGPLSRNRNSRTPQQRRDITASLVTLNFLRQQARQDPDLDALLQPYHQLVLTQWTRAHRNFENFSSRPGSSARQIRWRTLNRNEQRAMTRVMQKWNAANTIQEMRYLRQSIRRLQEPLTDPEMREAVGDAPVEHVPRFIFARQCDDQCPELSGVEAKTLKDGCYRLVDSVRMARFQEALEDFEREGKSLCNPLLKKYGPCFTGVRSIIARVNEIKSCLVAVIHLEKGLRGGKTLIPRAILNRDWMWLPSKVRKAVDPLFTTTDEASKHSQSVTLQRHGQLMNVFKRSIEDLELSVCDVCHRYQQQSWISRVRRYDMTAHVRPRPDGSIPNPPQVCIKCMKDARKSRDPQNPHTPRYSKANEMGFDTVPRELTGMNWIMKSIIARVHAVRSIVCLRDKGGQQTTMRATRGCMALVPIPTSTTIDHVAETLPSDAHLSIVVNAREIGQEKIICMPEVVAALEYFKDNNPHYHDVNINDRFVFSANALVVQRGKGTEPTVATDTELEALNTNDPMDPSLLRHLEEQAMRPLHPHTTKETAFEQYALQKNRYQPINNDTACLDELVLPWHFPRGRGGFARQRRVKVTLREFIRWAMANKDRRIASDMRALALYHGLVEQMDLRNVMATQARMAKGHLNNGVLDRLIPEGGLGTQASMHMTAKGMRGHVGYWTNVGKLVRGHIAVFGPPSWFLTLNPADKDWEDIMRIYRTVFGPQVDSSNIFHYISGDPFFYSRYFSRRVKKFFDEVLLKPDGPLGPIAHHFYRIEYQARGLEHVYCLLWAKEAPSVDAPDTDKLEYISSKITARLPDPVTEPELYNLVNTHQRHWATHSNTSRRGVGSPSPVTSLPSLGSTRWQLKSKAYVLARTKEETFINDYSPAILLAWGANVDVQFIWNASDAVVHYTTAYATKNEKAKEGGRIQEALKNVTTGKERFALLTDMLRLRDCGALEICDFLMGHSLYSFDSTHIFLNVNLAHKRDRTLKSAAQRRNEAPGAKAYVDNLMDTYYPRRPETMKNMSLIHVAIYYEATSARTNPVSREEEEEEGNNDEERREVGEEEEEGEERGVPAAPRLAPRQHHRKNTFDGTFHVHCPLSPFYSDPEKRGRPLVPRVFWPHFEPTDVLAMEDYCRRLLMLFTPWRDEDSLKSDMATGEEYDSYEERWVAYMEGLEADEEGRTAAADIEKLIKHQEALVQQDQRMREERAERREALEELGIDEDPDDGLEVYDRQVDEATHAQHIRGMNEGQRTLFKEITGHIAAQDAFDRAATVISQDSSLSREDKKQRMDALGPRPPPLLRTIVGNAGSGKSFFINVVADECTVKYTDSSTRATLPAILLTAPTGLAAMQINGSTIYAGLAIEVQHGRESEIAVLSDALLEKKRVQLRNMRLLIIDQLSMISNVMLCKIHLRLQIRMHFLSNSMGTFQDIRGSRELFGGVNVLLLGDFMQLAPVAARPIYEPISTYELLRTRLIPGIDAVGDGEKMDEAARHFIKLQETEPRTMALFGTNDEVAQFNEAVIRLKGMDVVRVPAEDSMRTSNGRSSAPRGSNARERLYQRAEYDISRAPGSKRRGKKKKADGASANRAGGLEKDLLLAIGGRVMLRRNIQPALGLVNGATGVLLEASPPDNPITLRIDFDGLGEHLIEKARNLESNISATHDIANDEKLSRRQFPVSTAFAATVHKCQGLTLSIALISTSCFFSPGQAFVAFSRVRTLDGIHILDLNPTKFSCKLKALLVYSRLRSSISLPALPLPKEFPGIAADPSTSFITPAKKKAPPRQSSSSAKQRVRVMPTAPDVPGTPPKRPRRSESSTPATRHVEPPLQLHNRKNDCFVISCVNLLHSLPLIKDAIIEDVASRSREFPILEELAVIFIGDEKNMKQLRALSNTEAPSLDQDQGGDVEEFLDMLQTELPFTASNLWSFDLFTRTQCPNGHQKVFIPSEDNDSKIVVNTHALPSGLGSASLEDIFNHHQMDIHSSCEECAEENTQATSQIIMRGKYIRVVIQRDNQENGQPRTTRDPDIIGGGNEKVRMFGVDLRPVALIQHFRDDKNNGLYVCWRKECKGWTVIDDSSIATRTMAPVTFGTCTPSFTRGYN